LSTIRKNPNAAIVGGMLLKSETESIDSAGGILTYPFGVPYGIKADEPRGSVSSWSPFETAFVGGALMAVDREKIMEIGGFDPDFFAYNEEVDLAWRARLAGYSIICVPSAMARHFSKSTWRKKLWARAFLIERNRIMTCVKNLSKMKLVVALMAEIVYATLIICGCLIYKEIEYLKSYLGALAWNFSNTRLLLMKRSLVQSRRKVPDSFVLTLHQHISLLGLLRMLLTIYRRLD
jgi:GT2 family glycosyltransferase